MIYNTVKEKKISMLGFGLMRLPQNEDKSIDYEKSEKLVDLAIKNGVNYFDTAYNYLGGKSEVFAGDVLSKYPRSSYNLASKYPGHEVPKTTNPQDIFEEQLRRCKTDYFDFYLLHDVYENSFDIYTNPKYGIVDFFVKMKKQGKIKHLGFSSHGRPENLKAFLQLFGDKMEFCQIQLNYLDWSLQEAEQKVEILNEYSLPIWVMEPLRGGKLANLSDSVTQKLRQMRPNESTASWSFNFLKTVPGVTLVLSGMNAEEQMLDNIKTFSQSEELNFNEKKYMLSVAEGLKNSVPCTACKYCMAGCPKGLNIPVLIAAYNEVKYNPDSGFVSYMMLDSYDKDKLPSACIGCRKCENICPQKIEISKCMKELDEYYKNR